MEDRASVESPASHFVRSRQFEQKPSLDGPGGNHELASGAQGYWAGPLPEYRLHYGPKGSLKVMEPSVIAAGAYLPHDDLERAIARHEAREPPRKDVLPGQCGILPAENARCHAVSSTRAGAGRGHDPQVKTQTTPRGTEIPIPKKRDFLRDLRKVSETKPETGDPKPD
jgi:hypothetical protein